MRPLDRRRTSILILLLAGLLLGNGQCGSFGFGTPLFHFRAPRFFQLSLPGSLAFDLKLPPLAIRDSLVIQLDGAPIPSGGLTNAVRDAEPTPCPGARLPTTPPHPVPTVRTPPHQHACAPPLERVVLSNFERPPFSTDPAWVMVTARARRPDSKTYPIVTNYQETMNVSGEELVAACKNVKIAKEALAEAHRRAQVLQDNEIARRKQR